MNTSLTFAAASEHIADLTRAAERQRRATSAAGSKRDQMVVVLRLANPEDDADITRLAQLDDAPVPVSPVMLAVVDGEAVAALSLSDGRAVANPFVATQKAVTLLRLNAAQRSGERRRLWRPRVLRPRIA
jgi:hypothetical protein